LAVTKQTIYPIYRKNAILRRPIRYNSIYR